MACDEGYGPNGGPKLQKRLLPVQEDAAWNQEREAPLEDLLLLHQQHPRPSSRSSLYTKLLQP